MLLFAPSAGALIVPLVSSVPGWPALFEYRPTLTPVAVEPASRKMRRFVTDPLALATYLNASAVPALLESTLASVAPLPTRSESPGGGGGGGGGEVTVPAAYAESAPSVNEPPVVHPPGRAVRLPGVFVSEFPEPWLSRNLRTPVESSRAIQYDVPDVTVRFGTTTVLNWPATGAASVPEVSSAPGWLLALFAYRPAVSEPVDPAST